MIRLCTLTLLVFALSTATATATATEDIFLVCDGVNTKVSNIGTPREFQGAEKKALRVINFKPNMNSANCHYAGPGGFFCTIPKIQLPDGGKFEFRAKLDRLTGSYTETNITQYSYDVVARDYPGLLPYVGKTVGYVSTLEFVGDCRVSDGPKF